MQGLIHHKGLALLQANSFVVSQWQDWHRDNREELLPGFLVTPQTMLITEDNIHVLLASLEAYRESRGSAKRDNKTQRAWLDRFIAELHRLINFKIQSQPHIEARVARIPHAEYREKYIAEIIRLTKQRAKRTDLPPYQVKELQRYLKPRLGLNEEVPENILREFRREAEARMAEEVPEETPPQKEVAQAPEGAQNNEKEVEEKFNPSTFSVAKVWRKDGVTECAQILSKISLTVIGRSKAATHKLQELRTTLLNRIALLEGDDVDTKGSSDDAETKRVYRARDLSIWQIAAYWFNYAVPGGPPPRYGTRTQKEAMSQHWKVLHGNRSPHTFAQTVYRAWETIITWAREKHGWTVDNPKHGFPEGAVVPSAFEAEITDFMLLSEEEQWGIVNNLRDFDPVPSEVEWRQQNNCAASEETDSKETDTSTDTSTDSTNVDKESVMELLRSMIDELAAIEEIL